MRAVGDEDGCLFVTLVPVIRSHNHYTSQLAVCPCHRLHCKTRHARNFTKQKVALVEDLQCALREHTAHPQLRQQGVQMRKAGITCNSFADLRIVFHRAGAERIEIGIHAEIHPAKRSKMPHDIKLTQLRQRGRFVTQKLPLETYLRRNVARIYPYSPASRNGFFKYQFHRALSSASANMPICCFVLFSVTQTRSEFSIPS